MESSVTAADLNFTVSEVMPLILRPDRHGAKTTTIRLAAKADGLTAGSALRLMDTRHPPGCIMGTARLLTCRHLRMYKDGFGIWDRDKWKELSQADARLLALEDGIRGPDPEKRLHQLLEGMYIHGRRMPYPLDLAVISWFGFQPDPDYVLLGEQLEIL